MEDPVAAALAARPVQQVAERIERAEGHISNLGSAITRAVADEQALIKLATTQPGIDALAEAINATFDEVISRLNRDLDATSKAAVKVRLQYFLDQLV
jgi:hypothetical protein